MNVHSWHTLRNIMRVMICAPSGYCGGRRAPSGEGGGQGNAIQRRTFRKPFAYCIKTVSSAWQIQWLNMQGKGLLKS